MLKPILALVAVALIAVVILMQLKGAGGRVDGASARQLVDEGAVLLDVRTPQEFAAGHIDGAVNIPVQVLAGRLSELAPSTPVVLYCRSGNRSGQAARLLGEAGFESVHDLGPMSAWQRVTDAGPVLVGVDGCRAGWVAATDTNQGVVLALYLSFASMLDSLAGERPALCVVDMPIGLPDHDVRACDAANRAALPGGASSVFSAPLRIVLEQPTYAQACAVSRAHHRRGHAVSKQSWFLFPKMREVDAVVRERADADVQFRETHPELIFRDWAGTRLASKKTREGRNERRALVSTLGPSAIPALDALLATTKRRELAEDDGLDALACLRAARRVAAGEARAVLAAPEVDRFGLEMNVWY